MNTLPAHCSRSRSANAFRGGFVRPGDLKKLAFAVFLLGLMMTTRGFAGEPSAGAGDATKAFGHVLEAVVDERGMVDYVAIAGNTDFRRAVAAQANALAGDHGKAASLASLINTHNAAVIHLLVEAGAGAGKVASILELEDGGVFDRAWIPVGSEKISLNALVKNHIGKLASDERYHFAVVCGAVSCPPLRAEPYEADQLQKQLDDQLERVVTSGDPRFVRWQGDGKVQAMKLMEWYAKEFGDAAAYLNKHANLPGKATSVSFLDYDWALNAQQP